VSKTRPNGQTQCDLARHELLDEVCADRGGIGVDEAEPQIDTLRQFRRVPECAEQFVEVAIQIANTTGKDAARPRQCQRPPAAVEKRDAERGFGTPDRLRHGGLRHPELAGRFEHAAAVRDSGNDLEASKIWDGWLHSHNLSKSHMKMQISFIT